MAITVKRTVLLGIGGTGVRVLQYIKGEFEKHFGGVPPAIKLQAFDTAAQKTPRQAVEGPIAELESKEYQHVRASGIRRLLEVEEMQAWTPPLEKWDLADILDGAGQRRPSGRLALFRNATDIYNSIYNAINQVKGINLGGMMEDWQDFEVPQGEQAGIEVYIVGSLAGGTGSGMFLDIAHMVRDILDEGGPDRIIGNFLLPGVFMKNLAATDFVPGNGYAALKEMDYWMDETNEEQEVHYPGGLSVKWGGPLNRPFNFVYLLDDVNEHGEVVNKPETMLNFMARGIFLHMTVQGEELAQFWSNLASILQSADSWRGKVPRYMSFGISSLEIPIERHIEQNVNNSLVGLLDSLRSEDFNVQPEKVEEVVDDFLVTNGIDADSLLDALRPKQSRWDIPEPPEKPYANTERIAPWKDEALSSIEEQVQRSVGEHTDLYNEVQDNAIEAIKERIYRTVHDESGHLQMAKRFVDALLKKLKQLREDLDDQAEDVEQQMNSVTFMSVEEALGGPFTFTKRRIDRLIDEYRESIDEWANLNLQRELNRTAKVLANSLYIQVDELQQSISDFERHLDRTLKRLRHEQAQLQHGKRRGTDVFATILGEDDVSMAFTTETRPDVDIATIEESWRDSPLRYELEENEEGGFSPKTVFGWRHVSVDELTNWLKRQVRETYDDLMDNSIDGIIGDLWSQSERSQTSAKKKLQGRLEEFMAKARPLWNVEVEPDQHLQYLLLIGLYERPDVPAPFIRTLIEDETINTGGGQESLNSYFFSSTWERFAIRALRIGLPAPIYALQRLEAYRDEYIKRETKPDSRVTHHIHRDWIGGENLPDLYPETGTSDGGFDGTAS